MEITHSKLGDNYKYCDDCKNNADCKSKKLVCLALLFYSAEGNEKETFTVPFKKE